MSGNQPLPPETTPLLLGSENNQPGVLVEGDAFSESDKSAECGDNEINALRQSENEHALTLPKTTLEAYDTTRESGVEIPSPRRSGIPKRHSYDPQAAASGESAPEGLDRSTHFSQDDDHFITRPSQAEDFSAREVEFDLKRSIYTEGTDGLVAATASTVRLTPSHDHDDAHPLEPRAMDSEENPDSVARTSTVPTTKTAVLVPLKFDGGEQTSNLPLDHSDEMLNSADLISSMPYSRPWGTPKRTLSLSGSPKPTGSLKRKPTTASSGILAAALSRGNSLRFLSLKKQLSGNDVNPQMDCDSSKTASPMTVEKRTFSFSSIRVGKAPAEIHPDLPTAFKPTNSTNLYGLNMQHSPAGHAECSASPTMPHSAISKRRQEGRKIGAVTFAEDSEMIEMSFHEQDAASDESLKRSVCESISEEDTKKQPASLTKTILSILLTAPALIRKGEADVEADQSSKRRDSILNAVSHRASESSRSSAGLGLSRIPSNASKSSASDVTPTDTPCIFASADKLLRDSTTERATPGPHPESHHDKNEDLLKIPAEHIAKSASFSALSITEAGASLRFSEYLETSPWNNSPDVSRSKRTSQSSLGNSNAREVTETWAIIAKRMKWVFLSLILNGGLLGVLAFAKEGVQVHLSATVVNQFAGIFLLIILLIANMLTIWSLNDAAACVFGYLLCSKDGFTFAACGYVQANSLLKMNFAQNLSLTSKYRKNLTRASFIWILVEMVKILSPISAMGTSASPYAVYNSVSACVYFVQDNEVGPYDRGWPTLETEAGVSEYVFGSSIGHMRSEMRNLNFSTAIFPPSLISPLNDGDTIQGLGFSADISTVCHCSTGFDAASFAAAGVDKSQAEAVLEAYRNLKKQPGITFGTIIQNDSLVISNVFSGYPVCGGNNPGKRNLPLVCSTTISNHQALMVEIEFMTDGTTASIAPNIVNPMYIVSTADIKRWLSFAIVKMTNGPVSFHETPATVPGSLSPLLWWTSPNLMAIDRALVEAGMETMYAILFKGAIQRTYSTMATGCPRKNMLASYHSLIMISDSAFTSSCILLGIHLFFTLVSAASFLLWFLSAHPIGPAVRAMQESIYMVSLLGSSSYVGIGLPQLCNAETYAIWQKLDVRCRIGESLNSTEEEIGKIVVDKPALVRPLKNGKRYC
ncbi:hypothetical protein HDU78_001725 [Chytriomyces hyalinus]|nr:hypothetical protein HDU78_001725 [Chytriomyces hyalinus]